MFGEINNIDIGFDINEAYEKSKEKPQKRTEQRSEDWFNKRLGSWTGSKIKNIMACNKSGSKMSWDINEKIYEFSSGIIKFIYERAMERKTGRYILSPGNANTKYGNIVERFITKIGEELIDAKIDEVGYKKFPDVNNAGASSDGVCKELKSVIEIKACANWQSHYDRCYSSMDEKSIDFWQVQAEMYAWGYEKCFYLVSEPPKDIMEYVKHPESEQLLDDTFDSDVADLKLFQKFKSECEVSVQEVKASRLHQKAMIERVKICEMVCNKWIKEGGMLEDVFWQKIDDLKSANVNNLKPNSENLNEVEVNEPKVVKSKEKTTTGGEKKKSSKADQPKAYIGITEPIDFDNLPF